MKQFQLQLNKFNAISFIVINMLFLSKVNSNEKCTLTENDPQKAYPSLIKCYRNNVNACCISAHDDYISKMMSNMLPIACQRKFNELELYFCYGCHYDEPSSTYRTSINKRITLCQDYAQRLWGGDLTQPSTQFDNCGITTYWNDDINTRIVIPSLEWANAYEFFADVKPPFFQDYTIVVTSSQSVECFDGAQGLISTLSIAIMSILLLLTLINA